jgi:FAD/FMN-containing dehydrogenase
MGLFKFSLFGFFGSRTEPLAIVWRDKAAPDVYEAARVGRLFNHRRPERYPLAVVSVKTESDIVDAVKLAIRQKCRISIRSGGHSWPAWSVWDNAILLDFGNYSEMAFDEKTGVVRISPSTTARNLVAYLASKGRVVSAGHCPDVGMGGFLLGGGMGWNFNVRPSFRAATSAGLTRKRTGDGRALR